MSKAAGGGSRRTGKERAGGGASAVKAVTRALRKGGFVQARPWRYIAIMISQGSCYPATTHVRKNDYIFWVNTDEREYLLQFLTDSPIENRPLQFVIPAKEPGSAGNFGLTDRHKVRVNAPLTLYPYKLTAVNWNGPPNPPDISVDG